MLIYSNLHTDLWACVWLICDMCYHYNSFSVAMYVYVCFFTYTWHMVYSWLCAGRCGQVCIYLQLTKHKLVCHSSVCRPFVLFWLFVCSVIRIVTKHGAWWLCYAVWVVNSTDPPFSASEALALSALTGSFYQEIKLELYIHSKHFWTKPSSQCYTLIIMYLFLNIV